MAEGQGNDEGETVSAKRCKDCNGRAWCVGEVFQCVRCGYTEPLTSPEQTASVQPVQAAAANSSEAERMRDELFDLAREWVSVAEGARTQLDRSLHRKEWGDAREAFIRALNDATLAVSGAAAAPGRQEDATQGGGNADALLKAGLRAALSTQGEGKR